MALPVVYGSQEHLLEGLAQRSGAGDEGAALQWAPRGEERHLKVDLKIDDLLHIDVEQRHRITGDKRNGREALPEQALGPYKMGI